MSDKPTHDSFCDALQSLRPANDQLDARAVFFAAGMEAARQTESHSARVPVMPILAAMVAAAVITAPLAFRAGQFTSPSSDRVAHQTESPQSLAPVIPDASSVGEVRIEPEQKAPARVAEPRSPQREEQLPPRTFTFARWLAWDAMVTATQIEREASPTLTAGHATLVSRVSAVEDLGAFRFSLDNERSGNSPDRESSTTNQLSVRPLVLGNQSLMVSSPESSR